MYRWEDNIQIDLKIGCFNVFFYFAPGIVIQLPVPVAARSKG